MRKILMVLVALVLVSAMFMGSASVASAGKPVPSFDASETSLVFDDGGWYGPQCLVYIECSVSWENIGAYGYKVEWGPNATDPTAYNLTAGGKRLRNAQTTVMLLIPEDTIDERYAVNVTLLDRKANPMGWWDAFTFYPNGLAPATTAMYSEHFRGVPNDELPSGWSTNRTDLCYVTDGDAAGGVAPELEIYYDVAGEGEYTYSDYWVSTPEIEIESATTSLTLSFDSYFELWVSANETYPYTIAVEVSANNGTTWNATSFVDSPTLTEYPDAKIGPERVYVDLSTYAGQTIMIRWRIYGYTYMMDDWDIDNVVLTGH